MPAANRLREVLPGSVKDVLRGTIRGFGTATSPLRRLPDFVIVGAQKGGTTALYSYLLRHPAIAGPYGKEIEFFDRNFDRGVAWYRGHFPALPQRAFARIRHGALLTGEASPSYLSHPLAPQRAASVVAKAKLIVLLRNPVDRALSQYVHERVAGREPLSFEDALDAEPERLRGPGGDPLQYQSYLTRGLYAEQLRRWLERFPREQLLVLRSEDFFADPAAGYAEVLRVLGAAPHELDSYPPVLAREYEPMHPETRKRLEEYYREPNRELAELLSRDFGWD